MKQSYIATAATATYSLATTAFYWTTAATAAATTYCCTEFFFKGRPVKFQPPLLPHYPTKRQRTPLQKNMGQ
jgi:hypothetical protein